MDQFRLRLPLKSGHQQGLTLCPYLHLVWFLSLNQLLRQSPSKHLHPVWPLSKHLCNPLFHHFETCLHQKILQQLYKKVPTSKFYSTPTICLSSIDSTIWCCRNCTNYWHNYGNTFSTTKAKGKSRNEEGSRRTWESNNKGFNS
ncbi:hypothetical protein Gotur_017975 [Gossypium turneri]